MHKIGFKGFEKFEIIPFWEMFYIDLGLDYNIRWKYTINRDIVREKIFYDKVIKNKKYIFFHDNERGQIKKPTGNVFNPNKNDIISNVIMDYGYIIENADEIHILDSAFYCLCNYLDLTKVNQKIVYTRCPNLKTYTKQTGWKVINL